MADNEGPKRSDFQEASKLPACGPGCEVEHGDQADPEQLELMHLRAEVKRLRSTSQELEIDRLRQESASFRRIAEDNGAVQAAAMVEISRLRDQVKDLESERECILATRKHWIFSEREMIRRRDVAACRARAEQREQFVHGLQMAIADVVRVIGAPDETASELPARVAAKIAGERAACAKVARRGHLMAIIPGETKQAYGARLANIIAFEIEARGQR